jgi:hypothetical protein
MAEREMKGKRKRRPEGELELGDGKIEWESTQAIFPWTVFHLLAVQWEFDIYCLLVSNEKFLFKKDNN